MYKTKNKMFSRENGNLIFNHKYMIFVKYFLFFYYFSTRWLYMFKNYLCGR